MDVAPDHQVIAVDGEHFAVDYDTALPGTYHFSWLTGGDPQYGFSSRISTHARRPQQELVENIRGFLPAEDLAAAAAAVRRALAGLGLRPGRQLWCTAGAAERYVERVEHEDYGRVPRVRLDEDRSWWPTPPGPMKFGHYGVLEADTALDPP